MPAVAIGVSGLAHEGHHHLGWRQSGCNLQRQVPVVGEKEAVAILKGRQQAAQLGGFVTLAGRGDGHLALPV